jgi:hypothetical protein
VTLQRNPTYRSQRITNVAEARALWEALETGEEVRVLIADEDINAVLAQEIEMFRFQQCHFEHGDGQTTSASARNVQLLEKGWR